MKHPGSALPLNGLNGLNGQTVTLGVIGDPVSHSFSPQIHQYFAALAGINAVYVPFHVTGAHLPQAIGGAWALGVRGLNITIPHKQAVLPLLSAIDPVAERVGAVNTLVHTGDGYAGYNTDHIGITRTLAAQGFSFKGRPVMILGAGGSAYAACVAAAEGGAAEITLVNRGVARARVLAAHMKKYYTVPVDVFPLSDAPPAKPGATVIQTTSVGFGECAAQSPLPDASYIKEAALAFDIIYTPWETVFLRQAKAAGVPCVNGFPMLVYQAAAAFTRWRDAFFPGGAADTPAPEAMRQTDAQAEAGAVTEPDFSADTHVAALKTLFQAYHARLHAH